ADHLKIFDLIFASDGITNLAGEAKRDRLVTQFGERGFDYAGNDRCDLEVWSSARRAILVSPARTVLSRIQRVAQVDRVFEGPKEGFTDYLKPFRLSHWFKNIPVFVPLLAAHRFLEMDLLERVLLAFLAFGCFASAGYMLNDLSDLSEDRHHPHKRFRAFAAGDIPLSYGLLMIPALLGVGCLIGVLVSWPFLATA